MKKVYEVRLYPSTKNNDVRSRKVTILYTTAPFDASDKTADEDAEGDARSRRLECLIKFCDAEGYHLGKHLWIYDSEDIARFYCEVVPKRYPY